LVNDRQLSASQPIRGSRSIGIGSGDIGGLSLVNDRQVSASQPIRGSGSSGIGSGDIGSLSLVNDRQLSASHPISISDDDNDARLAADGEVVGWVVVWVKAKKGSAAQRQLFLSSVEVKRAHRRQGVAKRLLFEAEALGAEHLECAQASLTVLKTNTAAVALYSRQGYVIDEGGSVFERMVEVVMDPQRILQHRMCKPLQRR